MKFALLVSCAAAGQNLVLINLDAAQVETTVKSDAVKTGHAIGSAATSVKNTVTADAPKVEKSVEKGYASAKSTVEEDAPKVEKSVDGAFKSASNKIKGLFGKNGSENVSVTIAAVALTMFSMA